MQLRTQTCRPVSTQLRTFGRMLRGTGENAGFSVFSPIAATGPCDLPDPMVKRRPSSSKTDAANWARRCHIEAVRAIHPTTKAFLLELAAEYEALSGEAASIDPDDTELQNAVADRLATLAAKRRAWLR